MDICDCVEYSEAYFWRFKSFHDSLMFSLSSELIFIIISLNLRKNFNVLVFDGGFVNKHKQFVCWEKEKKIMQIRTSFVISF